MSLCWGQGKIEVIKWKREILDFLASGMTESAIFRLLQAQGLKGHKATFHRALKKLRAEALPSPDDTSHSSPSGVTRAARTRAAKVPRPVALSAPSNSALPSSAGSAPAEVSALPAGDFVVPLSEPAPSPASPAPDPAPLPRAHSELESSGSFQRRTFSDNDLLGGSS